MLQLSNIHSMAKAARHAKKHRHFSLPLKVVGKVRPICLLLCIPTRQIQYERIAGPSEVELEKLLQILESPRVSGATRKVLRTRLRAVPQPGTVYEPTAITQPAFAVLQQVIARLLLEDLHAGANEETAVLPSEAIAAQLEESRATGKGNGWRYGTLPSDAEALAHGLDWIEETAVSEYHAKFTELSTDQQELLLSRIQQGKVAWAGFNSTRWFEEVLAEATEIYISHPGRMIQRGIDAFADEPDGWTDIGLNNGQPWEPETQLPGDGHIRCRRLTLPLSPNPHAA